MRVEHELDVRMGPLDLRVGMGPLDLRVGVGPLDLRVGMGLLDLRVGMGPLDLRVGMHLCIVGWSIMTLCIWMNPTNLIYTQPHFLL